MSTVCDCGDVICRAQNGYIYVENGISVCGAGTVHGSVSVGDNYARADHIIIQQPRMTLPTGAGQPPSIRARQLYNHTSASGGARGAAQRSGEVPLVLHGRPSAEKKAMEDLCAGSGLPSRVTEDAQELLESLRTGPQGTKFRMRGLQRQALLLAVVGISCERHGVDLEGERLRRLTENALGLHASYKEHAQFARRARSVRVAAGRSLGSDVLVPISQAGCVERIVSQAWGRLGHCGLDERMIARITSHVERSVSAWAESETKFGDALVPMATLDLLGEDPVTVIVCGAYDYRLSTISRHLITLRANAPDIPRA